jgi:hypothetical protein
MKPITELGALEAILTDCRKVALGPVLFRLHDGEDWVIETPTANGAEVLRSCNCTGVDRLEVSTPAGARLGTFVLVWGNAEDGEELISDYWVNDFTDAVFERFSARYS